MFLLVFHGRNTVLRSQINESIKFTVRSLPLSRNTVKSYLHKSLLDKEDPALAAYKDDTKLYEYFTRRIDYFQTELKNSNTELDFLEGLLKY